jgi:hypothetical protein
VTDVTERQRELLRVVHDLGEGDARYIDVVMCSRHGAGEISVRDELVMLEGAGLVESDQSRGVGGTWALSPGGRKLIDVGNIADPLEYVGDDSIWTDEL